MRIIYQTLMRVFEQTENEEKSKKSEKRGINKLHRKIQKPNRLLTNLNVKNTMRKTFDIEYLLLIGLLTPSQNILNDVKDTNRKKQLGYTLVYLLDFSCRYKYNVQNELDHKLDD